MRFRQKGLSKVALRSRSAALPCAVGVLGVRTRYTTRRILKSTCCRPAAEALSGNLWWYCQPASALPQLVYFLGPLKLGLKVHGDPNSWSLSFGTSHF